MDRDRRRSADCWIRAALGNLVYRTLLTQLMRRFPDNIRAEVLVADCRKEAQLTNAAKHLARDIGTARSIAQVLRQLLFTALRIRKARSNNDTRHHRYFTNTSSRSATNSACHRSVL